MPKAVDALIVGGGPAGAAVAARLAQRGLASTTLILERYTFPREKPCGGALTGHMDGAMEELGLVLDVPAIDTHRAKVRFHGFERSVPMGTAVRMIRRREFDASLLKQVIDRGVAVEHGVRVTGFEREGGIIRVDIKGQPSIRTKVLIGADGVASVVRKGLATDSARKPHRLFMAEQAAGAVQATRQLEPEMIYDFSLMSKGMRGYSWVFPSPADDGGHRINVGLMNYPIEPLTVGLSSRELLGLLKGNLQSHGVVLGKARGWPVWEYQPRTRVGDRGAMLVGDAAGIDGLTGEGIAVALEQGAICGDWAARGIATGDRRFMGYRKALRRAVVGRELALDRLLARLLYRWDPGALGWRRWLSLVLFDDDVIQMYARRVDGTEVLATQKPRLLRALARHAWRSREREKKLQAAERH